MKDRRADLRAMPVYLRKSYAFPVSIYKNRGYAAALDCRWNGGTAAIQKYG